jgi:cell wall-associated NlpC family hydrolase
MRAMPTFSPLDHPSGPTGSPTGSAVGSPNDGDADRRAGNPGPGPAAAATRRRPRRVSLATFALAAGIALGSSGVRAQEAAPPAPDGGVTARAKAAAHSALEGAQGLANQALSLLGVKYKFGGSRPETGLDCSGLVQYVFQQVTGVTLPRTAKEMSQLGDKVALDELAPGDLVFFNTRRFAYSHVGIYLGDNRFIHAPRRGREVEIAEIDRQYWQKRFDGARRLAGSVPELLPSLIGEANASTLPPAAVGTLADLQSGHAAGPLGAQPVSRAGGQPGGPTRDRSVGEFVAHPDVAPGVGPDDLPVD